MPADLSHTAGALLARGHEVSVHDLSAATHHTLIGGSSAFAALRNPRTYRTPGALLQASLQLREACKAVPSSARYRPRGLALPCDPDDVVDARRAALSADSNPALALLRRTAARLASDAPDVIAIALVHPDQKPQAPALARLLREAGYMGTLALYGSLEDVCAPSDFAPDLLGEHVLFEDFDGVIIGEAESALAALLEGTEVPNWLVSGATTLPLRRVENLRQAAAPVFDGIEPAHYPTPTPVVDLRLGRGCPWSRCAFCAIQAHQLGYRAGPVERVAVAMEDAHRRLGSTHFRIRDDLVTPTQLRALSKTLSSLPHTWTARSRFEPGLTRAVLHDAHQAGLSELWMGLESGSERVRRFMHKGVDAAIINRVLADCDALGIRVRALCIAGFPTETEAEYAETEAFLDKNRHRLSGFALTPFQVTRGAPMLQDPSRYGLTLAPDPIPADRRLRHRVCTEPFQPDSDTIRRRYERTIRAHAAWAQELGGTGPTHAWLRATSASLGAHH